MPVCVYTGDMTNTDTTPTITRIAANELIAGDRIANPFGRLNLVDFIKRDATTTIVVFADEQIDYLPNGCTIHIITRTAAVA